MGDNASVWKGTPLSIRLERGGDILAERRASEMVLPLRMGRKVGENEWKMPADDHSVSGEHAEIYVKGRHLRIRDLDSTNGIFVMGARVKDVELKDGVKVGIGNCTLIVEKDSRDVGKSVNRYHRLKQLNGKGVGTVTQLTKSETLIGSSVPDGGITCSSLLVSRHHAVVICKDDGSCWISDVGSSNGTRVNQALLKKGTERMLAHNDVISCADIQFRFLDKNKPDPVSLKKIVAVVLLTMACFCTGNYAYNSISPSAKSLIAEAKKCEMNEQFSASSNLLVMALDARGHENCDDEIRRMLANLSIWTDTLANWSQVADMTAKRQWISASDMLGRLLSSPPDRWGWNSTSAQIRKSRAATLYRLISVFLDARKRLGGNFSDADRREFKSERNLERLVLEKWLQSMDECLGDKEWTDKIPSGELRGDMLEQRDYIAAVIGDLRKFEQLIDSIREPQGSGLREVLDSTGDFAMRVAQLEHLSEEAVGRDKARAGAAEKAQRKFVKTDIVPDKCKMYVPVLRKFQETRGGLEANCAALVQFRYDSMKDDLPTPSDYHSNLLPVFGKIRHAFRTVNEKLVKETRDAVKGQVERLQRLKVGTGKMPECFAALLDDSTMKKVFACDTLVPGKKMPAITRTERMGEYDRILGVEEFGAFVSDLDREELLKIRDSELAEPLFVQTMHLCQQLETFRKMMEKNQEIGYLATIDVKGGNKLHDLASAALALLEKRGLLVDSWWNVEGDDVRARLLAHAAAWALDGGKLDEEDKAELVKEFNAWRDKMVQLNKQIGSHPEAVDRLRPQLLSLGIPGNSTGNLSRHWNDAAKQGGAP